MKWFYNLKRSARIIIAVVSWLPLIVFSLIIGGSIGENGENMQAWQAFLTLVLLAVPVLFLVFAIKARKRENADKKPENSTPPPNFSTRTKSPDTSASAARYDVNVKVKLVNNNPDLPVNLPVRTKVKGVTFEGRQEYLAESKDGDPLIIKHSPTQDYPNTVAVINDRTKKRLGNIGGDLADKLLDAFGAGCEFGGKVLEITGGDGNNYGCNIIIENVL